MQISRLCPCRESETRKYTSLLASRTYPSHRRAIRSDVPYKYSMSRRRSLVSFSLRILFVLCLRADGKHGTARKPIVNRLLVSDPPVRFPLSSVQRHLKISQIENERRLWHTSAVFPLWPRHRGKEAKNAASFLHCNAGEGKAGRAEETSGYAIKEVKRAEVESSEPL
jgi:hypothetical protein